MKSSLEEFSMLDLNLTLMKYTNLTYFEQHRIPEPGPMRHIFYVIQVGEQLILEGLQACTNSVYSYDLFCEACDFFVPSSGSKLKQMFNRNSDIVCNKADKQAFIEIYESILDAYENWSFKNITTFQDLENEFILIQDQQRQWLEQTG